MQGWIVVNSFYRTQKFEEMYRFFLLSAEKLGITLKIVRTDELLSCVDSFIIENTPDFVLFWDKDIYYAQLLESKGIRLFNSARAIELCDNKILTALALSGKADMPRTVIAPKTYGSVGYNNSIFIDKGIAELGLPIVIKEAYGSYGQQVYLAESVEQAKEIFARIGASECVMQEFIEESRGRDVRINVVGGKAVACMLRENATDFRSNISGGGSASEYTPTIEQECAAIRAAEALGLDFAGVDVLFGKDGKAIVCEVNSNPNFKSVYDCTGVDLSMEILKYIERKLAE